MPEAYQGRGVAYQRKGEKAKAEKDFDQAKKLGYRPPSAMPGPGL